MKSSAKGKGLLIWPAGWMMAFAGAYLWFFVALGRPGWHWRLVRPPLLVVGAAILFNTVGLTVGSFNMEIQKDELVSGYWRSLLFLFILFAPMTVIAWIKMNF